MPGDNNFSKFWEILGFNSPPYLIEPDKMWMRAGVHHSDLTQKHLQHQFIRNFIHFWQTFVFSGSLLFCVSVSKVVIHVLAQVYYCNHRRWWVVGLEWAFSPKPPPPPRNVLFMKVSLLCDHSSFDGPHWIVHDCQAHFHFLPVFLLHMHCAETSTATWVWRMIGILNFQHWVFRDLMSTNIREMPMLNIK